MPRSRAARAALLGWIPGIRVLRKEEPSVGLVQEPCKRPPIWGKPCTFAMRYVNDREAGTGVTLMRDGIEGAGPLVPTPGPRQGSPMPASRTDDGNAKHVRILSVLGGPLERAGPHPLSGLVARRVSSPRGKSRRPLASRDAMRVVDGGHPYTALRVGEGSDTLSGAMDPEGFLLGLIDHIYAAAFEPARWEAVLAEVSAALGDAAIYLSLRIHSLQTEQTLHLAAEADPALVYRIHLDPKYHPVFIRLSNVDFPRGW